MQATGTTASPPRPTKSTVGVMERPESLATEERRSTISRVPHLKPTISQEANRSSTLEIPPRGRLIQPFQLALLWVQPTAPSGARRPPPSHKRTSPSTPTTRAVQPRSCSTWASILEHQVRSSTSQRTTRSRTTPNSILHRNSSMGQLETAQRGRQRISTQILE